MSTELLFDQDFGERRRGRSSHLPLVGTVIPSPSPLWGRAGVGGGCDARCREPYLDCPSPEFARNNRQGRWAEVHAGIDRGMEDGYGGSSGYAEWQRTG